jgi:lysozyme
VSWVTVCAPLIHGDEGCAKAVVNMPGYFTTYLDATGTPTLGWGSTGPDIILGMVWSAAQCESRFETQMAAFAAEVDRVVKVPINENQKAALVCFEYNVGEGALASSTLLKLLNAGDYAGAAAQFHLWNHSKGVVLADLTERRAQEATLFMTPVVGEPVAAPKPLPTPAQPVTPSNPLAGLVTWLLGLFKRK